MLAEDKADLIDGICERMVDIEQTRLMQGRLKQVNALLEFIEELKRPDWEDEEDDL